MKYVKVIKMTTACLIMPILLSISCASIIKQEVIKEEVDEIIKVQNELEDSLRKEIDQKNIEVQRYRDALTIKIADRLFFRSGDATIKKEGHIVLDSIGKIMKSLPDNTFRIDGHTDDVQIGKILLKKYQNNWMLGAHRATNVAEYLRENAGIDPAKLMVATYAYYRPILPNSSEENRAKNRRIEIIIMNKLDLSSIGSR